MRIFGWLTAAVPVCFALLRVATTGTDFRYLWVAVGSIASAGLVVALGRRTAQTSPGRFARAAAAVCASTVASAVVAFAEGAGSVPAVLVVSCGFALCSGIGLSLAARRSS